VLANLALFLEDQIDALAENHKVLSAGMVVMSR
jgi:hypothetical protein